MPHVSRICVVIVALWALAGCEGGSGTAATFSKSGGGLPPGETQYSSGFQRGRDPVHLLR